MSLVCSFRYILCQLGTDSGISIFRIIHCILFPHYPPNLNIVEILQVHQALQACQ